MTAEPEAKRGRGRPRKVAPATAALNEPKTQDQRRQAAQRFIQAARAVPSGAEISWLEPLFRPEDVAEARLAAAIPYREASASDADVAKVLNHVFAEAAEWAIANDAYETPADKKKRFALVADGIFGALGALGYPDPEAPGAANTALADMMELAAWLPKEAGLSPAQASVQLAAFGRAARALAADIDNHPALYRQPEMPIADEIIGDGLVRIWRAVFKDGPLRLRNPASKNSTGEYADSPVMRWAKSLIGTADTRINSCCSHSLHLKQVIAGVKGNYIGNALKNAQERAGKRE